MLCMNQEKIQEIVREEIFFEMKKIHLQGEFRRTENFELLKKPEGGFQFFFKKNEVDFSKMKYEDLDEIKHKVKEKVAKRNKKELVGLLNELAECMK
ncbi:hypothetical protein [uncultured archaeal virus]|uniref:Uncharacterized protein n=1 Tax=uncultured archaeal virus TaxID=1960247 RepID=A0A8B0LQA9_9VIRU|nr:hypothetical protein [uncultured archaeal virus]